MKKGDKIAIDSKSLVCCEEIFGSGKNGQNMRSTNNY